MVQPQKIETVAATAERLRRSHAVVVVGYQGLTVAGITALRAKLREAKSELRVVKNRLSKRALEQAACDPLDDLLRGPVALAFGFEDPAALAKSCVDYAKTNEKIILKGALLDKKRIDAAKLQALAKLPSRAQLLSQMAAALKGPARRLAGAMNQSMAKIVHAMKARADQMAPAA